MSNKAHANCKICRRLGVCVFKFRCGGLVKRPNPPGQHGGGRPSKKSQYGLQLTETQKLRYYYGISAKQLRRYYKEASSSNQQTNVAMISRMETRLDNLVYRMGFAGSLKSARQMVVHRHILVNGKNVNKPAYQVKPNDMIQLRDKSQKVERFKEWFDFYWQDLKYIKRFPDKMAGMLLHVPEREEIPILVDDQLVVEFMAR